MLDGLHLGYPKFRRLLSEIVDADENTGRPFACNWRDAGRTSTSEFFWRETSAGCPSRIIACCCGSGSEGNGFVRLKRSRPTRRIAPLISRLRMIETPQTRRHTRRTLACKQYGTREVHRLTWLGRKSENTLEPTAHVTDWGMPPRREAPRHATCLRGRASGGPSKVRQSRNVETGHLVPFPAVWDDEASVWSGHCDDIPAAADASTLDELLAKISAMAP